MSYDPNEYSRAADEMRDRRVLWYPSAGEDFRDLVFCSGKYPGVEGVTQYQHVEDAASCDGHFHMLCRQCGNLMHVDCELMGMMADHLMAEHGFRLDPRETLLVGVCEKCRKDGGEAVEHGTDCHEGCHHSL